MLPRIKLLKTLVVLKIDFFPILFVVPKFENGL